jgi:putative transposase
LAACCGYAFLLDVYYYFIKELFVIKIRVLEKFRNKYRIPSARLQNWDYGSKAIYYITICTAGREHYFGKVEKKRMQLFEIGRIANEEWLKTPDIRPDMNLFLDEFVVMPNHIHILIIIGENEYNMQGGKQRDKRDLDRGSERGSQCRDNALRLYHGNPNQSNKTKQFNHQQ